jgi:hypothetical protein
MTLASSVEEKKPSTSYTFQVGARNPAGTHWSVYFTGNTAKQPAPAPASAPPPAYHAGRQVAIDTHATAACLGTADQVTATPRARPVPRTQPCRSCAT